MSKSILYWKPEQPPPSTITLSTNPGSSSVTFCSCYGEREDKLNTMGPSVCTLTQLSLRFSSPAESSSPLACSWSSTVVLLPLLIRLIAKWRRRHQLGSVPTLWVIGLIQLGVRKALVRSSSRDRGFKTVDMTKEEEKMFCRMQGVKFPSLVPFRMGTEPGASGAPPTQSRAEKNMLRFLLLFTAAFCVSSSSRASPGSRCLHVNNSTHRIVDTDGRERYFHGVNVVVKGPPWLPELQEFDPLKSFVEKDMQTLQELGLNAIRSILSCSYMYSS